MRSEEEIWDQIKLYEHYIEEWENEHKMQKLIYTNPMLPYIGEIKLCKRLVEELKWVLGKTLPVDTW